MKSLLHFLRKSELRWVFTKKKFLFYNGDMIFARNFKVFYIKEPICMTMVLLWFSLRYFMEPRIEGGFRLWIEVSSKSYR